MVFLEKTLSGIFIDKKSKTPLPKLNCILLRNNLKKAYPVLGYNMAGIEYKLRGQFSGMPYYFGVGPEGFVSVYSFELSSPSPESFLPFTKPNLKVYFLNTLWRLIIERLMIIIQQLILSDKK